MQDILFSDLNLSGVNKWNNLILKLCWANTSSDNDRLKMGIVHASKEAAQAHADAISTLYYGDPCSD